MKLYPDVCSHFWFPTSADIFVAPVWKLSSAYQQPPPSSLPFILKLVSKLWLGATSFEYSDTDPPKREQGDEEGVRGDFNISLMIQDWHLPQIQPEILLDRENFSFRCFHVNPQWRQSNVVNTSRCSCRNSLWTGKTRQGKLALQGHKRIENGGKLAWTTWVEEWQHVFIANWDGLVTHGRRSAGGDKRDDIPHISSFPLPANWTTIWLLT